MQFSSAIVLAMRKIFLLQRQRLQEIIMIILFNGTMQRHALHCVEKELTSSDTMQCWEQKPRRKVQNTPASSLWATVIVGYSR